MRLLVDHWEVLAKPGYSVIAFFPIRRTTYIPDKWFISLPVEYTPGIGLKSSALFALAIMTKVKPVLLIADGTL